MKRFRLSKFLVICHLCFRSRRKQSKTHLQSISGGLRSQHATGRQPGRLPGRSFHQPRRGLLLCVVCSFRFEPKQLEFLPTSWWMCGRNTSNHSPNGTLFFLRLSFLRFVQPNFCMNCSFLGKVLSLVEFLVWLFSCSRHRDGHEDTQT